MYLFIYLQHIMLNTLYFLNFLTYLNKSFLLFVETSTSSLLIICNFVELSTLPRPFTTLLQNVVTFATAQVY